jgi:predicted DNA-binding mobile mystery protein A
MFMKAQNTLLVIRQLDKKMQALRPLEEWPVPASGWIALFRVTLKISLRQLGNKLFVTSQGMKRIEKRDADGTLSLNGLKAAAAALNMKLVYGFIPQDGSLERMIERKALEMAQKIVQRTSTTMKLEDQENSEERIKQAILEMAEDIKREIPTQLWD